MYMWFNISYSTVLIRLKPRYPLMGIPLMILDHIVAQDVRGLEILDIPKNPNQDPDLRRDSAPAARRPCKVVVTTYLPIVLIRYQECFVITRTNKVTVTVRYSY